MAHKTPFYFIAADVPMSKTYWLDDEKKLQKSNYPNAYAVTSHKEHCSTIAELHAAIIKHAAAGHCLVKGLLQRDLLNESRKGSTTSDTSTTWICLDLDGAPHATPAEFMASIPELKDVSYIVQYSASYGLNGNKKLSCHIFILLSGPIAPGILKQWLMHMNLYAPGEPELRKSITLSSTGSALHWPVDLTACQNDKLLYIAPPTLGPGIRCSLKPSERIQLVIGTHATLEVKKLLPTKTMETLRDEARDMINGLRGDKQLKPLRYQLKLVGELEVQPRPGESVITGMQEARGYRYFNLNGGDSWGYYHPLDNPEFILNFKSEPAYYTKELLPDYHIDIRIDQKTRQSRPTQDGDIVLAFRDKRTAMYWNGTWNEENQALDIHPARSELQLDHWMQGFGMAPHDVIPVWSLEFNPQSTVIIDDAARTINTYVPTPYFRLPFDPKSTPSLDGCPLIKRIILHAVSGGLEDETYEHFMNWLAVIFQYRIKTKTAWVLHGTEGTGKGVLVSRVLAPLLGRNYVQSKRASELEEKFNGWLEPALIVFIDEIKVSASARKEIISGDLRNFITEDVVTIRHMNRAAVQTDNYTNIIASSNETDPVMIRVYDRRYNIGHFQKSRITLTQHDIDTVLPAELEPFMHYIMTRSANKQMAATSLKNQAHADLVEHNKTSIDVTVDQLVNGDLSGMWDLRVDLNMALQLSGGAASYAHMYHSLVQREVKDAIAEFQKDTRYKSLLHKKPNTILTYVSRFTRDELNIVFEHCVGNMPKTPNKFTSLLKHRGIKTERMRIHNETQWGMNINWKVTVAWAAEIADEFELQEKKSAIRRVK